MERLPFAGYRRRRGAAPCCVAWCGGFTLVQDGATVHLSEDDVAYLLNLLRNSTQPVTTQQLIDALRRQSSPAQPEQDSGNAGEIQA